MKKRKTALIFDTDAGTDDAAAFLFLKKLGTEPDYIVATGGNASADGAVRNTVILQKYLGLSSRTVRGYETKLSTEKNTFHGKDGLANISAKMMKAYNITDEDVGNHLKLEEFEAELPGFDSITYIAVGPVSTLSYLLGNREVKEKIKKVYLMGGGIREFNCSHNTEFNFSKNPEGVKNVLSSGLDITLFPLDLTNHQTVSAEQIGVLEKTGNYSEYITMLKYNLKANSGLNEIGGAVLHDTMPVLYYSYPEKFTVETANITCDRYAHLELAENGYPVGIAVRAEDGLLFDTLKNCFYD